MSDDDKNNGDTHSEEPLELTTPPQDDWQPADRRFDDFEEEDEFEESDRDTDFASMYTEVEEEEPDHAWGEDTEQEPWPQETAGYFADNEPDTAAELPPMVPPVSPTGFKDDWEEEEEYFEDYEEQEFALPLGLIIVGVIALILLAAGGYGVMQDRAALQEEIRQLQGKLATTAQPGEVAKTRAATEEMSQRNQELEQGLEQLSRENRSLEAIIAGLEKQLQAQQEALVQPAVKPKPAPAPASASAPKPTTAKPAPAPVTAPTAASSTSSGTWFVNFGSYNQQDTAESWARRLQPGAGKVIVSTGEKDGKTFYRVRVVDLASREQADTTARKLEKKYDLVKLWVGEAG